MRSEIKTLTGPVKYKFQYEGGNRNSTFGSIHF